MLCFLISFSLFFLFSNRFKSSSLTVCKFSEIFLSSCDISSSSSNLKGTFFRIERDFLVEITEARQRLWPKFKTERENYPPSRVTIGYPAKIIRNGRVTHDEFPDWYDVLHCSRVRGFEINETTGKESRRKPFRPWQA